MRPFHRRGGRLLACLSVVLITGCQLFYDLQRNERDRIGAYNPPYRPHTIALLLPHEGPEKHLAEAIKDGFLMGQKQTLVQRVPFERPLQVHVLDTGNGREPHKVLKAYRQALSLGAERIVGPLTKLEVQSLLKQVRSPSVPILALNQPVESVSASNEVLFFGLSPEDEAVEVARMAAKQSFKKAMVIIQASDWGRRASDAFRAEWRLRGGEVLSTFALQGKETALKLPQWLGQQLEADFVFLVAPVHLARTVRTALELHARPGLPVLTTSHVYDHNLQVENKALEGVLFCDMPFIIGTGPDLERWRIMAQQTSGYTTSPRLFALGLDAFQIASELNDALLRKGWSGLTGFLQLTSDSVIHRQLLWAEFKNGTPILLP